MNGKVEAIFWKVLPIGILVGLVVAAGVNPAAAVKDFVKLLSEFRSFAVPFAIHCLLAYFIVCAAYYIYRPLLHFFQKTTDAWQVGEELKSWGRQAFDILFPFVYTAFVGVLVLRIVAPSLVEIILSKVLILTTVLAWANQKIFDDTWKGFKVLFLNKDCKPGSRVEVIGTSLAGTIVSRNIYAIEIQTERGNTVLYTSDMYKKPLLVLKSAIQLPAGVDGAGSSSQTNSAPLLSNLLHLPNRDLAKEESSSGGSSSGGA